MQAASLIVVAYTPPAAWLKRHFGCLRIGLHRRWAASAGPASDDTAALLMSSPI